MEPFSFSPTWGMGYDIRINTFVPRLDLMFLAEQDFSMVDIPNLTLISAERPQSNGLTFEYIFGDSPPSNRPTAPKRDAFGRLILTYIFDDDNDLERYFPDTSPEALAKSEPWKHAMTGLGYAEIYISTPHMSVHRTFGDLDRVPEHPNIQVKIDILRHLNSALLRLPQFLNERKQGAIRTIKPLLMKQALRPPGAMGNENTGGVLYKRGLRNFSEAAGTAGTAGAGNARRRTRKQRRV